MRDNSAQIVPAVVVLALCVLAVARRRVFREAPRTQRLRARMGDRAYAGLLLAVGLVLVVASVASAIGN